ncbi:MAG: N-formylglutamate deformylase [Burkholderiaceae bacterium]|nr:N-formylglutamate deformylase [Burkholderiaceae bacterium]
MNTSVPTPAFIFRQGRTPLLVSMPHVGTHIPEQISRGMTPAAHRLADTDWHLDQLYDFLDELGASVLVATHSRYVIDLNRPPDNANLYPGQDTTGLCPVDTFDRQPLYQAGKQPSEAEIAERRTRYWQPYHTKLSEQLQRLRTQHGVALLWDAHSIASEVPRFFEGRLPDFNIGTASGSSCAADLSNKLGAIAETAAGYSMALNGRFKGGHITRHYGNPAGNTHAVQLELSQITYMEESHPYRFDERKAQAVRPTLRQFLETMLAEAEK